MATTQWQALMRETIAACDMTGVLQQADDWLKQGVDYWRAWNAYASSYGDPQNWLETADGISKTLSNCLQDWTCLYGLMPASSAQADTAKLEEFKKTADAQLAEIKKERAALKRNLTLKERTLQSQLDDLKKQGDLVRKQETEIDTLQAKVKSQAERLLLLEAAAKNHAKPAAQPVAGATVPPAVK